MLWGSGWMGGDSHPYLWYNPCPPTGLEPEIQKLIAKHKQEVRRLRGLHEAELQQREEQATQRHLRQAEELREHLEREREVLGQQERERAQQR